MQKNITVLFLIVFLVAACTATNGAPPENETLAPTNTTVTDAELPTATANTEATETATPEPEPTVTNTPQPITTYPPEGYGPVNFPENVNPLTGLPVADPSLLDRRPVSMKISNYPRGIRPQWGLSLADHVFEYYHESGLTRFFVVFYGQDTDMAGPIRSARLPDEHLVRMYKSVFAFGSADERVRQRLYSTEFWERMVTVSDIACPPTATYPTCRIEPEGWNHLMTDTAILSEHFTEAGIPNGRQYLDGLLFQETIPAGGQAGNSLITRYSFGDYNQWLYDPTSGKYDRYADAAVDEGGGEVFVQLIDRFNDRPVQADNVVLLLAEHSYFSQTPEMVEIKLFGFGTAYVFRDGQVYEVNWVRSDGNELIALTYDDGTRFPLKPGNTWFQVVGLTSNISVEDGDWRAQFWMP